MLRGERDQNGIRFVIVSGDVIPECSGGSEIKTKSPGKQLNTDGYQNAPGGARSKPLPRPFPTSCPDTRMLRGERDQNGAALGVPARGRIPECSGGSEIKTPSI